MKTQKIKKTITITDLYRAWNVSKRSSENYIGKRASESAMVRGMAQQLGLLPKTKKV